MPSGSQQRDHDRRTLERQAIHDHPRSSAASLGRVVHIGAYPMLQFRLKALP